MRKAKRILSMLLVLAFAVTVLLTGCGAKNEANTPAVSSESSSTTASTEPTVAEQKQLDPYEVKWYMVGTKQYPETNLIEDELAKALKDINTTVKIQVFPWGDYPTKMSMLIASGEQFDICFMGTWTNYYQNVAKGAFVDLTDVAREKMPNLTAKMNPGFLEGPKVKGRLYGLPTNKEAFEAYGIEVDKEFAAQAGVSFDSVKTYADLEPILAAAKEKLPADVFPMVFQATSILRDGMFDYLGDVTIPGIVKLDDTVGTVINQFESPEFMANWQLVRKWFQAGYINKNAATKGAPDYWNQRKGLCRVENMGPVPEYVGSKGQTIQRVYIGNQVIATGSCVGALMCFSKTSKDVNRAFQFFDTVNSNPDLYNLVAFGIKDKHYRIIDENTNPKRIDFLEGVTEDTVGYVHSGGAWSLGGDWFSSYLSKTDPANRNEYVDQFNKKAVQSKLIGFSFDAEPVKTEVAACANVYQELGVPLNCGAVDPATTAPKFIEKLKAAGVDRIIAEKQKQLDQWKKDNGK